METVLIVEDDAALRLALTKTLRSAGYKVLTASTGAEGIDLALGDRPDLVILDVMLPEKNGFEVCAAIRGRDPDMPVLMLTAKGEESDKVRGLRLGADDYVVKPVGKEELLARIDAALRRRRLTVGESTPRSVGHLVVDFSAHAATRDGAAVEMTAHEMRFLRFLLQNEGRLLPRARILDAVWGADYFGTDRTVDNFVNRLRSKIENDPKKPRHLVTIRGAGYRFTSAPSSGGDEDAP